MENTLVRSEKCADCGAVMLWTQNAWPPDENAVAAYRCPNGHVIDPSLTRQCPQCGLHDTERLRDADGRALFRCFRCRLEFEFPRGSEDAAV
jgi:DNA-directed RNA polymerase subunit RPC12/RpoP